MTETRACARCGTSLTADAPRGLCPKCVNGSDVAATEVHQGQRRPERPATAVDDAGFQRVALELGLLKQEDLDRVAGEAAGDASKLAKALVRAGRLSSYQAGAILQGKARGLAVGEYRIVDKIGQGGMGVVFKARKLGWGADRVVALKILPPSFVRDREAVRRFRREFEVAARLSHPNVVSAIEAAEDRNVQFLAMEFIDGHNLDDLVTEVGPLPIKLAIHCTIQAARGLEAAHAQGIIHRDVKPGNLMLDASGNVRVLDLGLARVIEASNPFGQQAAGTLTRTGAYMGTVDFIAPEQADDSKRADHRADVYSLACTLYFLLTGHPPFPGDTILKRLLAHQERPAPSLHAARPDVPAALEAAYQTMMAKRPDDRPRSMTEIIGLLEACRTSTAEAKEARASLKNFAETVMKRASPKKRLGLDATVFARPGDSGGIQINPDLNLEDLIGDYRDEAHTGPLPEDKLPPKPPRLARVKKPKGRSPAWLGVGAFAVLGLLGTGYALFPGSAANPEAGSGSTVNPSPQPVVAKTAPEPAVTDDGVPAFKPIFNGKDLAGWRPFGCKAEDWAARDGDLTSLGEPTYTTGGWLGTEKDYEDFDLSFQFKLGPGCNSGVYLRCPPDPAYHGQNGIEVQLIDHKDPAHKVLGDWGRAGSIFGVKASEGAILAPNGDWNAMEIRMIGPRLRVQLNGRTVIEDRVDEHPDRDAAQPGLKRKSGRIGLQRLTGSVTFGRIYIRELKSGGESSYASATLVPGTPRVLFTDDFNDSKSGWTDEPAEEKAKNAEHHYGYVNGLYVLDGNVGGGAAWSWNCPRNGLTDFSAEVVGRIHGDRPGAQGSWGVCILGPERSFEVRIRGSGELTIERSFRTADKYPNDPPRVGPIRHPAIKPGGMDFNKLTLRVQKREFQVLVNNVKVCDPVKVDWDLTPALLQLAAYCEAPSIRAEFDRVEIKELAGKPVIPSLARGDELRADGKLSQAVAAYREAIRAQPDLEEAHQSLIRALSENGQADEALAAEREMLRLTIDTGDGYADLAFKLNKAGRQEDAVAAYREAARLKPSVVGHHSNLANLLTRMGKRDETIAAYRKALEFHPDHAVFHNNLAWALLMTPDARRREVDDASVHAQRAVDSSQDAASISTLGAVEYFAGHLDKARGWTETAMKRRDGGDANEWFVLAMIDHRQGETSQARTLFDKAVAWTREKQPKNRDLRILWTEAAAVLGLPGPGEAR